MDFSELNLTIEDIIDALERVIDNASDAMETLRTEYRENPNREDAVTTSTIPVIHDGIQDGQTARAHLRTLQYARADERLRTATLILSSATGSLRAQLERILTEPARDYDD